MTTETKQLSPRHSPDSPERRFLGLPPSLLRCAASSLTAVALEFALLSIMVSVFHFDYLVGALLSTAVYLLVNFILNRRWAFRAAGRARGQIVRHVGVAAVGTGMAMLLLRFFVRTVGLPYQLGWAFAGCINFGTWTYPMNRLFTFKA